MPVIAEELLVLTNNPEELDRAVLRFGAIVVRGAVPEGFVRVNGAYVVRCYEDVDFIKFLIALGWGTVVKEYEVTVCLVRKREIEGQRPLPMKGR